MTTEQAYLEAALPEPVILLHQRLQPYSLGHELILRRLNSPFLNDVPCESDKLKGKLFTAVYICANRYEDAVAGLRESNLEEQFERWRKLCGPLDAAAINQLVISFLGYLKAGRSCPEFSSKTGRGQRPGAPFLLLLEQILTAHLGFSRSEALNCPFGLAQWHYCAFFESKGSISIRGHELDLVRAKMRELGLKPIILKPEQRN